jgi:dTMP kinase
LASGDGFGWIFIHRPKGTGQERQFVVVFKAAVWLGDVLAHRDDIRLWARASWEAEQKKRLRVSTFEEIAEYHLGVAKRHLDSDPALVERDVAPLLLCSADLTESTREELEHVRASAKVKLDATRKKAEERLRAAEAKRLAEERAKAAEQERRREEEEAVWRDQARRAEEERKRLADPRISTKLVLCRALGELDYLYGARARQEDIEREGGLAELKVRRAIGERIVAYKEVVRATLPKFRAAHGRDFRRAVDCIGR